MPHHEREKLEHIGNLQEEKLKNSIELIARNGCVSGLKNGCIFQCVKVFEEVKSTSKEANEILPPVLKQRIWFLILMKLVSSKSTCLQRLLSVGLWKKEEVERKV